MTTPRVMDFHLGRLVPASVEPNKIVDFTARRLAAARISTAVSHFPPDALEAAEESPVERTAWEQGCILYWSMMASAYAVSALTPIAFVGIAGRRMGWW